MTVSNHVACFCAASVAMEGTALLLASPLFVLRQTGGLFTVNFHVFNDKAVCAF